MAEECVVVASINNSKFSEVSQDVANDSGDELIISGDGDEINSLPYDNTPLVSLNNSTSDLNGAVSSSPSYSAMSPTLPDAPRVEEPPAMECEAEGESNNEKVEMIFETPVVHHNDDDDDDDDGEKSDPAQPPSESTKQKHRQKGASSEVRRKSVGDSPRMMACDEAEEADEAEGEATEVADEVDGMCVKKVSCKRARKCDGETSGGASCSKANGPKVRHASAAADEEEDSNGQQEEGNGQPEELTSAPASSVPPAALFAPEDHAADAIYDENDVQSMDAIERRDFEREQQLIGGVIIRNDAVATTEDKLKLNISNHYASSAGEEGKKAIGESCTSTTPTSSRSVVRTSKVKVNLSSCLVANEGNGVMDQEGAQSIVNSQRKTTCRRTNFYANVEDRESPKEVQFDAIVNHNSNDSLSSDRSSIIAPYITPMAAAAAAGGDEVAGGPSTAGCSKACASTSTAPGPSGSAGTSSAATQTTSSQTSPTCQYAGDGDLELPAAGAYLDVDDGQGHSGKAHYSSLLGDASEASTSRRSGRLKPLEAALLEPEAPITIPPESEHDFGEDDAWGDCDEGSDVEEVCTCREYTDEENVASSEDELLPSRDVDLSGYTYDYVHETSGAETPRVSRKRKISEIVYLDGSFMESGSGRKRITLEGRAKATVGLLSPSASPTITSPSTSEKRTPRSIIPTKDNPPPELGDWLMQFQRWTQPERLLALDRLIDLCEPTQVRHMMKVIEPQFQRDFISLLPKELALQVLSYLEPKDLLRAAQTCRNWRFLCDDNLLWKEKCKRASIIIESATDRPKRGRAGNMPPISSPWKAAYIRQSIIEMNWRSRPVREPKVLKGHDDHVITCLQFCGNRIVSGSDDNTLKVWSAITGKCLRTLVGHTGGVWSSQMSANIIISGSTDRTLKVWNADTGQCIHTLYGHTSTVRCMHLHGNKVVSGSRDATLRVWDVTRGICLHILVGHLAAVRCVQYDGKLVVSGAYDYMVKVWNPEKAECLHTLQGHTNRVYSLQFDGIHVVSGSLDTSIRVWDAETGSCKHTLMGHQSLTSGMELRQNILVSGNADSTVKVWDILTGQCLQTLSGPNKHQSAVTCLQFNSRFVITSSDDGTVKLWDVKTGEFIRNLVALDSGGSGGVVWRIRANDTKLICAVGSRNGTEETKLMVLDFDVEGACLKCS
ncbi:F-box/WD repeat-containing protein 7 [Phlebotomus argentipes]|uniref:F-box/WD repeat-containing protein 7 n=1 Tax=Phlebotomus argentipes TaxID=94469 RepID=UPI002892E4FF|nr:F-box/WD repeat-containing protein 7 [Phlebotomus argentipes]